MAKSLNDYSRPVQASVVAGIALALAGVAAWYWTIPMQQNCSALGARVQAEHAQNLANLVFEQRRKIYERRIAEQAAKLQSLAAQVPDDPDADSLVNALHAAETGAGIHVRSLSAGTPMTSADYIELPFKLRADGNYFALVKFFESLAVARRLTSVTELALDTPGPSTRGSYKIDGSETVAADFVLSAYYNRPAGAAQPLKKK